VTTALVTGATGFTGARVVPRLLGDGYHVRCLVRASSDTAVLPLGRVELVHGDLGDEPALAKALRDVDVLVNIASLGWGHAPTIVRAAAAARLRRAVFLSTAAIFTTLPASSKAVRVAAEQRIHDSDIRSTILRPTMIYGSARDRNISRLIHYLRRWPVIPVFGDGESLQQPVHVDDVVDAVIRCLRQETTVGRSYNIPGAAPLTYNELIDTTCALLRRRVRRIHLALAPVARGLAAIESLGLRLPVRAEQVRRLGEDKAFDFEDAARDFGYAPRSFAEGLRCELREMGLLGAPAP
jgi:nucleoside-diphosphate-sugar epimerase